MLDNIKRFDMKAPAMRQHLLPLIWLLSFPAVLSHRNKLTKINMKNIKPPYLLLCNHNAFMDFKVATKAVFPHRANYVVAIDGFWKREWLLRLIGCICKRKFTNDVSLIRQLKRVLERGDIAAIYPEARYSLCGTTALLPDSLGKFAKLMRVPVVTLICHGHHVNSPFWNLPDHKVKGTQATMKCLFTAEELTKLDHKEINEAIRKEFIYDDYKWQKENGIRISYKDRAKGLHKVLYKCPACKTEYRMSSGGSTLRCEACGKEWEMTELGELRAKTGQTGSGQAEPGALSAGSGQTEPVELSAGSGQTEFSHIPDWYEWERSEVRKEIESGSYGISCRAQVDALPNSDRYIYIGMATLTHDMSGFTLSGSYKDEPYQVKIDAPSQYSVHIEYDYLGKKGDCVDLNTINDTLYVYPEGSDFSVTKMSLATEELYKYYQSRRS
ncbi:MAG: 1-acyl-sn-glycerol-3-phosphate acyltransferase [Treponemataceae bacterium]|nr:1-acyl-sn-glycerol-3-phosphate acyltransferase [Treponemataceae bacterium]